MESIPRAILKFFTNIEVIIPPDKSDREHFFNIIHEDTVKRRLKKYGEKAVEEFSSLYGHILLEEFIQKIVRYTAGFTYCDLHVIARDIASECQRNSDICKNKEKFEEFLSRYKPSLPDIMSMDIPEVKFDDILLDEHTKSDIIRFTSSETILRIYNFAVFMRMLLDEKK